MQNWGKFTDVLRLMISPRASVVRYQSPALRSPQKDIGGQHIRCYWSLIGEYFDTLAHAVDGAGHVVDLAHRFRLDA